MPFFAALQQAHINIWFDEGIRAGYEWECEIIENLSRASGFLFFVSEKSLKSVNCRDELYQARQRGKRFINVLVEDIDFSNLEYEWFDFRYARYQQIPAYAMSTQEIVDKVYAGFWGKNTMKK